MKIDNKLILENSKKFNILYVEDDSQIQESTKKLFLNYFANVDLAKDGVEALEKYHEYYKENSTYYDLIISDISMPNMDGLELAKNIRVTCFEQAFILITAHDEVNFLHSAIDIGVNGFLKKPIDLDELKSVLYKTTQKISDTRIVHKHYEQIEESNILTSNLTDASELNTPIDIIDKLIQNKEKISLMWMDNEIIHEKLETHTIDVEYFRSHYGIKVVEYFLKVIQAEAKVGNCPVIIEMLDFFKHKDLPLEDIFMICVLFKNTVTAYIFEQYSFNKRLFKEMSLILDKNFEGVIVNYLKLKNNKKLHPKVSKKIEAPKEEIEEEINYTEYVLENDVYELQDLEDDIDSLAVSVTVSSTSNIDNIINLGERIQRYGTILSNYPIFSQLGSSISKLGNELVINSELLSNDSTRMSNITALIEGFVNDLIVWRKEIFDNNIKDHTFLNSSFFSNVDTIIMFINYDESLESDENFDDDMFF